MVLNETFGATGNATAFFGGAWYLVGLFILLIFIVFLMAYNVSGETIALFSVIGLLVVSGYQLFIINEQITQTILLFIFIFVGYFAYKFFSK